MTAISLIRNFISVADTLELDGHGSYLHVGDTLRHVDATHKKSGLNKVVEHVRNILSQDCSVVSSKEIERFRHAFSCVISNYEDDEAYEDARSVLKTISARKLTFNTETMLKKYNIYSPGILEKSVSCALVDGPKKKVTKRRAYVPLPKLKDNPNLCIEMIVDSIQEEFGHKNYNGKHVVAIIHCALVEALETFRLDPSQDIIDYCFDAINDILSLFEANKDRFTVKEFQSFLKLGWLDAYDESAIVGWPEGEVRIAQMNFPVACEQCFEEIMCDDDVENAIIQLTKAKT